MQSSYYMATDPVAVPVPASAQPSSARTVSYLQGLALGLLGAALVATAWTSPTSLHIASQVALPTFSPVAIPRAPYGPAPLYAGAGFGASTPKKKGGKGKKSPSKAFAKQKQKSKPVESFLTINDDDDGADLPIEQLPTTIYDSFNPDKDNGEWEELDPGLVEGLEVLKYPHPLLRAPNAEVTEEELLSGQAEIIARKMFALMYATKGIGLAAPQVGINKRMMVYNPEGDKTRWQLEQVLINPVIVSFSDRIIDAPEGCLSFPTKSMNPFSKPGPFQGTVYRPDEVTVSAMNLKGQRNTFKFKGWAARIFMHEYDHLDGVLWIDRLIPSERERVDPNVQALIKDCKEPNPALLPTHPVKVWEAPPGKEIQLVVPE